VAVVGFVFLLRSLGGFLFDFRSFVLSFFLFFALSLSSLDVGFFCSDS